MEKDTLPPAPVFRELLRSSYLGAVMRDRPRTEFIIGWLFVGFGSIGAAASLVGLLGNRSTGAEALIALAIRILAILGGALLLRGFDWARWLLLGWAACHVVIGALHDAFQLLVHAALFLALAWLLFRPRRIHSPG